MQTYFQLLNFEEDIPGFECRPENAKRRLEEQNDGVTLEEEIKKDPESKNIKETKPVKEVKRRRSTAANAKSKPGEDGDHESEEAPKAKKGRGRKKKDDDDEDYVPESEKKASPKNAKKASANAPEKKPNILDQAIKEATLDEIPEAQIVVENVDTKQIFTNHKIPEGLKIVNIDQPSVKVEAPPPKPEVAKTTTSQTFSKATITAVPSAGTPTPASNTPAQAAKVAGPRSGATAATTPRPVAKTVQQTGPRGIEISYLKDSRHTSDYA